ncbi:hypothetical protein [Chelativorans alearense]|uniref:hypothetical protein n=1 Tax=Chelativorans alearense TaxID=2681495 RepID=UPI0013D445D1|nr:hypothetical protein [Chelativorans alearense]
MFDGAVAKTAKKLGEPPQSLRLKPYADGLSLPTLHLGSCDDEDSVLARLHDEVMLNKGFTFNGLIYLSDPRKTKPSKLMAILRQPVMVIG